jgi:hypothetical protein
VRLRSWYEAMWDAERRSSRRHEYDKQAKLYFDGRTTRVSEHCSVRPGSEQRADHHARPRAQASLPFVFED